MRHLLSKLPLHFLKLTALLHCVWDPGCREKEVSTERVLAGKRLLEYHRDHTMAAYAMINFASAPRPMGMRESILRAIERCGGSATLNEIRIKRGGHDKGDELRTELEAMVLGGILRMEIVETGGRPATKYTVAAL